MIYKIFPGREAKRHGFRKVIDYVLDNKKKGFILKSEEILSFGTASAEMSFTACRNPRVKRAVYHFTVAWGSDDRPNQGQMMQCVEEAIQELGLAEHQWIAASHVDATHDHIHVVANRVNPTTFKCASDSYDYRRLMTLARKQESDHGWTIAPQPSNNEMVSVGKFKIPERDLLPVKASPLTIRANAFDGKMSFQDWLSGEPRSALLKAMAQPFPSWYSIHNVLAEFAVRYEQFGEGASVYDSGNVKFRGRAGHLGRFATLPQLQKRLGEFKEPLPNTRMKLQHSYAQTIALMPSSVLSDSLTHNFEAERSAALKLNSETQNQRKCIQRSDERNRRLKINEKKVAALAELRKQDMSNEMKRLALAIIKYSAHQAHGELNLEIASERHNLKKELGALRKPLRLREWLNAKFKLGHREATDAISDMQRRQRSRRSVPENLTPADISPNLNERSFEAANTDRTYKVAKASVVLDAFLEKRSVTHEPVAALQEERISAQPAHNRFGHRVEAHDDVVEVLDTVRSQSQHKHGVTLASLRRLAAAETENTNAINVIMSLKEPERKGYSPESMSLSVLRPLKFGY